MDNKGFTVLEIIIVLFMLGVVATIVTPNVIKSRTDEVFIAKAQQEIEARLNAAKWYYNDYKDWPATAAVLKGPAANANNPSGTPYLPAASETSPFNTSYVFSNDINTFSISVNVPNDLANRLGSRLISPTYAVSGSVTTVKTTIPKPGEEAALQNYEDVKYMSIVDPGTVVSKPTCAAGKTAYIYVAPTNFKGGTTGKAIIGATTKATDNGDGTWTVTGEVKDVDNTSFSDIDSLKLLTTVLCR